MLVGVVPGTTLIRASRVYWKGATLKRDVCLEIIELVISNRLSTLLGLLRLGMGGYWTGVHFLPNLFSSTETPAIRFQEWRLTDRNLRKSPSAKLCWLMPRPQFYRGCAKWSFFDEGRERAERAAT